MKQIISALFVVVLISCAKEDTVTNSTSSETTLNLLQHRWILDSVIIYRDSNVYGNHLFAIKAFDIQYLDFRKDSKVYSYGGFPTVHYDTSSYQLLPNNTTLLLFPIKYGTVSSKADTAHIMRLTNESLMYRNRNSVGEHARWVLKR